MDEAGFRQWLEANYAPNTVQTKLSEARQLRAAYGDLDALYDGDRLEGVMQTLRYTAADKAAGRPNPSKLNLRNDLNRDLSAYRTTINYYRRYREGDGASGASQRPDAQAVHKAMDECASMGLDAFLDTYRFGRNITYWAVRDGEKFPSKAVFGVAYQYMPGGTALDGDGCNGTDARRHLARLGFEIIGAGEQTVTDAATVSDAETQADRRMPLSTNLILYGPPGTGKTYCTAAEAVRLCDGLDPHDPLLSDLARRSELRSRYDHLVDAGQVRLVTFHQNYSYEEFVEGLRPVTDAGGEDDEATSGSGFRLEPKRGIFREICAVAENARKNTGRRGGFDLAGRKLFKMSLGRSGQEDHIFDGAIEGGYAVLGWGGDVDWSDPRYVDFKAILGRWREDHPDATGNDPNVVQLWSFRSAMKEGDLVVVSAGNSHFRAIGEVVGPYRYDPGDTRSYNHRRAIRWLHVPDEPLPVEMIYGKKFMMQSCYQMKDVLTKRDALSRLLPGDDGGATGQPDQFVLIIDEINRANVSKVFGELITLIEPDKRLGSGPEQLVLQLPYSGEGFGVPANLHIVGTMNTADRSIALLDTALRRRFVFRELAPDPALLPETIDGVPLRRVLETINDRIEYLIDREHRIGHAFFLGQGGRDRDAIHATMRDKVIPLLQEYFFEDWARVAAVLGERPGRGGGFLDCRKLRDPTGGEGDERESWSVRQVFADDAYDRLIGKSAVEAPLEEAAE